MTYSLRVQITEACRKCGCDFWQEDVTPRTWHCLKCGNLLYYSFGSFKQQIDHLMESRRKVWFVKSVDGKKILPRKNSELQRIKLSEKLGRVRK